MSLLCEHPGDCWTCDKACEWQAPGGGEGIFSLCCGGVISMIILTHSLRSDGLFHSALRSCMSVPRRIVVSPSCQWETNSLCLSPSVLSASKQFAEELLQSHNEYRRKHQAPPLKLSEQLSKEATRWVNLLHTHTHTRRSNYTPNEQGLCESVSQSSVDNCDSSSWACRIQ